MPNVTSTIRPYVNTAAEWNSWCSAISAALTAVGVAKVPDTGSVGAWGSVAKPAVNTTPAFEIRKLADPTSGASPVYVRFEFGIGSAATTPAWRISVGTGTDGAGNLTGPGSAEPPLQVMGASQDTGVRQLFASSDGDGFVLAHATDSANSLLRAVVIVDRQRNSTGSAAPNSGWPNTGFVRWLGYASSWRCMSVDPVSGDAASTVRLPAPASLPVGSGVSMVNTNGDPVVAPCLAITRQGAYMSKMAVAYPRADIAVGGAIDTIHLGVTRTFKALGDGFLNADVRANVGMGCAMWWED